MRLLNTKWVLVSNLLRKQSVLYFLLIPTYLIKPCVFSLYKCAFNIENSKISLEGLEGLFCPKCFARVDLRWFSTWQKYTSCGGDCCQRLAVGGTDFKANANRQYCVGFFYVTLTIYVSRSHILHVRLQLPMLGHRGCQ